VVRHLQWRSGTKPGAADQGEDLGLGEGDNLSLLWKKKWFFAQVV
jgi:hypothetical protein